MTPIIVVNFAHPHETARVTIMLQKISHRGYGRPVMNDSPTATIGVVSNSPESVKMPPSLNGQPVWDGFHPPLPFEEQLCLARGAFALPAGGSQGLLLATNLFLLYYVLSVSPAGREKGIGVHAYRLCFHDRLASGAFEVIITANFILYHYFPLMTPLPKEYPWSWWILLVIAALIGIPAIILMATGLREAGEEAMRPKKEHCLYGGIYTQLRHPQAVGEVFLFPALAFLLYSPFLTLFSLIYFPIFIILCCAEEQDLLLWYGEAYADYCKHTGAFWPIRKQNEKGCGGCIG
jgi:protein-S-isoprenylcysteine O-methyltransferase Ste14